MLQNATKVDRTLKTYFVISKYCMRFVFLFHLFFAWKWFHEFGTKKTISDFKKSSWLRKNELAIRSTKLKTQWKYVYPVLKYGSSKFEIIYHFVTKSRTKCPIFRNFEPPNVHIRNSIVFSVSRSHPTKSRSVCQVKCSSLAPNHDVIFLNKRLINVTLLRKTILQQITSRI